MGPRTKQELHVVLERAALDYARGIVANLPPFCISARAKAGTRSAADIYSRCAYLLASVLPEFFTGAHLAEGVDCIDADLSAPANVSREVTHEAARAHYPHMFGSCVVARIPGGDHLQSSICPDVHEGLSGGSAWRRRPYDKRQ
jgi:hypothetical protein